MKNHNIVLLLQGKLLLAEVNAESDEYRAWTEISLLDELKPVYPFRTEPYAMIGLSPYTNVCDEFNSKFKVRTSYFLVDDIENNYDPCYDRVGKYIELSSLSELINYLDTLHLSLDDFVDASHIDEYPL